MNIDDFDIDAFVEDAFKDDRVATTYSKTDAKYRAQVSVLKREISDIGKQKVELEKKVDKMQRMIDEMRERRVSVKESEAKVRKLERLSRYLEDENVRLKKNAVHDQQTITSYSGEMRSLSDKLSTAESLLDITQKYINYVKDNLPEGTKTLFEFYGEIRHEYK